MSEHESIENSTLKKNIDALSSTEPFAQTESDEDESLKSIDEIENILDPQQYKFLVFELAKNKARFSRLLTWYTSKESWLEVAPLSGVNKLLKQQKKELESVRSSKSDYEMELATGTLTPSQRLFRNDELKLCKVREKMAVGLTSKIQVKIKSGLR